MILDELSNSRRYEGLSPGIAQALKWLRATDPTDLDDGTFDLPGGLKAEVFRPAPGRKERHGWQSRRHHAVVISLAEGREALFRESLIRTKPGAYDEADDRQPVEPESWADLELEPGQFVILMPGDAFRIGVSIPGADAVLRLTVEVPLG